MDSHGDDSSVTPVIGRAREFEKIVRTASASESRCGTVLITGEPGVGKSTLIRSLPSRLTGWGVAQVQADTFESDLSYAVVDNIIAALLTDVGRFAPKTIWSDPVEAGRALLDAIDLYGSKVCIFIDDVQWVDELSARALRFAIRRVEELPVLIVAAGRPETNPLTDLFDALANAGSHQNLHVELAPFTVGDTQELALSILGTNISHRLASQLSEASAGSPLLLTMMLQDTSVSIETALHPASVNIQLPRRNPLTANVMSALHKADTSTATAAEVAAVLRDPTSLAHFGTIVDNLGETADPDTSTALGLTLLDDRDGVMMIKPTHALLADTITARLTVERRKNIHRSAADVLPGHRALRHRVEAADRTDSDLIDELINESIIAADRDRVEQAMSYARAAVQLAGAGEDHSRSMRNIGLLAMRTRQQERIFDLISAFETLPPSLVTHAILTELLVLTRNIPGAFQHAYTAMADSSDDDEARLIHAHVAGDIPMIQMATRDFKPAIEQIRTARRHLDVAPTNPDSVTADLRWLVQPEQALMRLLGWMMTAAGHVGDTELVSTTLTELDELLERAPDSPAVIDALVSRARILILMGKMVKVREDLTRANELARRFPTSWTAGHARTIYAHVLFLLGEWDESVTIADSAVAFALDETDLSGWPVALAVSCLVLAARAHGNTVAERLNAAEKAPLLGPSGPYDPDLSVLARAELARANGDPQAQLDATDESKNNPNPASMLGWLTYRIDALAALGRPDEAEAELVACTQPGSRWQPGYGSLSWLHGRIAEARDDFDTALTWYEQSGSQPDTDLYPFPGAVANLDRGRALLHLGLFVSAADAVNDAANTFRRLGAAPYLARCNDLLDTVRTHVSSSGETIVAPSNHIDPFATLTTRERQVAHAVASGLTNREIAEQFYVSVTTVNFHVRNILSKLDVVSRRDLRPLAFGANPSAPRKGGPHEPVKS